MDQGNASSHTVVVEKDVSMSTRDGVTLSADVYRPDADGRFPVLVVHTRYDKSGDIALIEKDYFLQHGYVVVVQDTRDRFRSEGEFYPFIYEARDGYDSIEWVADLSWSNGNVGAVDQSYLGLVQYLAAQERLPHLRAMSPVSGPVTYFENCTYRRGVFELGWMLAYFIFMARDTFDRKGLHEQRKEVLDRYLSHPELSLSPLKKEVYRHLPLSDWGDRLKGATDLRRQLNNINVPMLHVASWYDAFQYDTLTLFSGLPERAMTAEALQGQKLLMGPWNHLLPYSIPTSGGTGAIDFGPEARIELHDIQLRWFDYFLKGQDTGVPDEPPIRLFVMGDNRWRDENEWPLARTQYTDVYLHSGGKANSLNGDGTLSLIAPNAEEQQNAYVYDLQDPAPTRGGTTLGMAMGVLDQNKVEVREDVLVDTGDLLNADMEVSGPISLTSYAASSASDTDFTAKLVDVRPDGYAQNIAEGVIPARFRESLSNPTVITPGEVHGYTIDPWVTSHVFKASHRLRLEVSSSNFPRYDRNPNTGHDFSVDRELRTIFHENGYPSHRTLLVIPS